MKRKISRKSKNSRTSKKALVPQTPSHESTVAADDDPTFSDVDTEDDLEELSRALDLDKHGRLRGVRGLRYESASFSNFLSATAAATLKADCLVLDRREAQRGEGSNVSGINPKPIPCPEC